MNAMCCAIYFEDSPLPNLHVPQGKRIMEFLSMMSSPAVFGCRAGICGTCIVHAEAVEGELNPAALDEQEVVQIHRPGDPKARLACQILAHCSMRLRAIRS